MSQVDLLDPLVSIQWEKGSTLQQKIVLSVFRTPGLTMLKGKLYVYFSGTRNRMSDDYAVLYCLPSDLSSWVEVCQAPVTLAGLSTYHSMIALVGGLEFDDDGFRGTDKVWMLQGTENDDWDTSLPPMPTKRLLPAVVNSGTTESECLIVAGGLTRGRLLNTVEVLKEEQWTKIPPIPYTSKSLNHTIHNGILYLATGKGVNTCNLQELIALCKGNDASKPENLWRHSLRNRESFHGLSNMSSSGKHLIQHVVDDSDKLFYAYSFDTRSWVMLGETPNTESSVVLPTDEFTVLSSELDADANCLVFYAFKGRVKGS